MSEAPPDPPRSRALADLDALIAKVEAEVEARRLAVRRSAAAKEDSRMASGRLRVAEQRLAQLRASRRVLLGGEVEDEKKRAKAEANRRWRRRRKV